MPNSSRSQRRKEKEIRRMKINEDRISNLPDPILLQILSLINIKLSVQTSLLSKRWRYIWIFLPNLHFDFSNFPFSCRTHANTFFCYITAIDCKNSCKIPFFVNFVNNFLSLHQSTIFNFRLSSPNDSIGLNLVKNCVNYAISHSVQNLDVSAYFSDQTPFKFPPCFYLSQSLTVLKLKDFYKAFLIPKPFSLPALKTLYLERFTLSDEDNGFYLAAEPFSGFPNLESLTLHNCQLSNSIIRAEKLRILDLLFYGHHPIFSSESKIVISTPGLEEFKFEGQVSLDCSMDELPCLDTVYVDLWTCFEEPYTDQVKARMPLNLVMMLGQLRNAKSVTLSMDTIEVLAMDPGSLESHPSPFCNLKHMKLETKRTHIIKPRKFTPTTLPCNVMAYLTQGSSHSDTLVVEIPKE